MKQETEITDSNYQVVANELAKLMVDEFLFYTKTKNVHGNIEGADFYDKHKFFEVQARLLSDIIDRVAERIRLVGHFPCTSSMPHLELTNLTEVQGKNDSQGVIMEPLADHGNTTIL